MKKQKDNYTINVILFISSILFICAIIMLSLTINESIKDKEDAMQFCNSINMSYSYDEYQYCYIEDSDVRYISKIIRTDDGYRFLKSGERLI